jgi:hypothetical protein
LSQISALGWQVLQDDVEPSQPTGQSEVLFQAEPSEAQVWTALPSALHLLLAGLQTPVQSPGPVQTKSQSFASSQVPIALHSSERLPLQRLAPGMHEPPQLPLEQRFRHAVPADQAPFWSQVSGLRPVQRFMPGLHSPPQTPWPVQTQVQAASGTHMPWALHVAGA